MLGIIVELNYISDRIHFINYMFEVDKFDVMMHSAHTNVSINIRVY
jgi:hypothetical protein